MMTPRPFAAAFALAAAALPIAVFAESLDGVPLGVQIPVVVASHGVPAAVVTSDTGNRFEWDGATGKLRCTTDDDARVRAIDWTPGSSASLVLDVDGKPRRVTFGSFTAAQADAQLSSIADYSSGTTRTFRTDPDHAYVFTFEGPGGTLSRAVYGERLLLVRAGILPSDLRTPAFPFKPPKAPPNGPAHGTSAAIVRVDLDRAGVARSASVLISSGDPAFDARVRQSAEDDRYTPATLSGRAIGATMYREYWH